MISHGLLQGGAILGACLAVGLAPRAPLPRADMLTIFGLCGVAGGCGGRLLWWLAHARAGDIEASLRVLCSGPVEGGFSSLGVLGGAALTGLILLRLGGYAHRALELVDFFSPIVLLSLAIARLGCVVHGCDFGVELSTINSPMATRYYAPDAFAWQWFSTHGALLADGGTPPLFPFPLMLSLVTIAIVLLASIWRRLTMWRAGTSGWSMLIAYGVARCILETWRHEATAVMIAEHGFSLTQAITALWIGACAMVWWMMRRGALHDTTKKPLLDVA